MQAAFTYVGYGGRVIFVGLSQGDITFPDPLFHSREVTLRASRNALAADFDRIIAALQAYRVQSGHLDYPSCHARNGYGCVSTMERR